MEIFLDFHCTSILVKGDSQRVFLNVEVLVRAFNQEKAFSVIEKTSPMVRLQL